MGYMTTSQLTRTEAEALFVEKSIEAKSLRRIEKLKPLLVEVGSIYTEQDLDPEVVRDVYSRMDLEVKKIGWTISAREKAVSMDDPDLEAAIKKMHDACWGGDGGVRYCIC